MTIHFGLQKVFYFFIIILIYACTRTKFTVVIMTSVTEGDLILIFSKMILIINIIQNFL